MQELREYLEKRKRKKKTTAVLAIAAILTCTLATTKLTGISMPIKKTIENIFRDNTVVLTPTEKIKEVKDFSSSSYLNGISIGESTIQGFTPQKLNYGIILENRISEINVSAQKQDENQEVTGIGTISLTGEKQNLEIIVLSSDKQNTSTYTITIDYNTETLSSDSSLKSLKVDKGTMIEEFNSELHEYTVKLAEDEYIVNFELETNDPFATINESDYINVVVPAGNSKHKINVCAQDGTTTTYTINFVRETTSYKHLDGITINNKYYEFQSGIYNYEIILPYNEPELLEISADYIKPSQKIEGLGKYLLKQGKYEANIKVTSEDKKETATYNIKITKEHSNKLKTLAIAGININPEFNSEQTEYRLGILDSITKVNVCATAWDDESIITIQGQDNITIGSKITINVTNPNIAETLTYTITCEKTEVETNYEYEGTYKEFIAPYTGLYKLECWGGIGGKARTNGSQPSLHGKGGYAKGEINLQKGEKLYIYVGQNGNDAVVGRNSPATWNGGGLGTWDGSDNEASGSGGGATDIRLISGEWNDEKGLASRIMVAGGAGGTSWTYTPGNGGGLSGTTAYSGSPAGTQTSGYLFGIGRNGWGSADNDGVAGGGGGYYGGQTNNISRASSGAGGSGYISGHEGCIAINSESDTTPKVDTYTEISDSYHYSGKIFTKTELTTGVSETSKATVTILSISESEFPIKNITVNTGRMTRTFNSAETDYYIDLDKEEVYPVVSIETTSNAVEVEGGLEQTVETIAGETIKQIKVKGKDGTEYIYNLHFVRKPSSDSHLKGIKIDGNEIENFKETTMQYEITIPYNSPETLNLDAIKKYTSQTIEGLGNIDVSKSTSTHTITVTSEDGINTTTYSLTINRMPTTKLKECEIKNQDFAKIFESDKYEYELEVTTGIVSLDITAIPYDENAKVVIKGAGYIKEGRNHVTITVSKEGLESTVYNIYVIKGENLGEIAYDFKYTGDYQTFTAPAVGYYKFEAWGAQGGYARINGSLGGTPGKGGYTSGTIRLNEGDTVYIYVGSKGSDAKVRQNAPNSWNGGGLGTWDQSDNEASGGGGGATDFRLVSGEWNDINSLNSRIMVAGAGRRSIMELQRRLWWRIKWNIIL